MANFLACRISKLAIRNFVLMLFLAMFSVSCTEEDLWVKPDKDVAADDDEADDEAEDEEEEEDDNSDMTPGHFADCTDERATNVGSAYFDDNTCQYMPVSCASCDYVVEKGMGFVDNEKLNLPPGATIGIRGEDRGVLTFKNFNGTEGNPYIFVNCDGKAVITGDKSGIRIVYSKHIRLTGTGSSDDYGIKVMGTAPYGVLGELGATDIEIDHLEITATQGPAISIRTRPVCDGSTNRGTFVQRNSVLHHNFIHDSGGEAFYIGGSHWNTKFPPVNDCPEKVLLEPELDGVYIYNNYIENVGQDGIQVGGATKNVEIYNNKVINYGLKGRLIHQSGIQMNPGTVGNIYNNLIKGGTGKAIFLLGFDNQIYNNVIMDANKDAIHIGDRDPYPGMSYKIMNNTMININGYAINTNTGQSVNNQFYNNILIKTQGDIYYKNSNSDFSVNNNYESEQMDGLFEDGQNLDFTPLVDSPLIDQGLDLDESITTDYILQHRKVGSGVDIGAFEHQGGI